MKTLARAADKTDVLRRLREVRPDSVARWGRMSAHQMICHLSDCFRMMTGEKAVRPAGTLLQRTFLKWTALYLPLSWPTGLPTSPEVDQAGGGTRPVDFAADMSELVALVELITARRSSGRQPHPVFGSMSDASWLRWGYLHMDHHLRQFGA
jgi:hypothetical protein